MRAEGQGNLTDGEVLRLLVVMGVAASAPGRSTGKRSLLPPQTGRGSGAQCFGCGGQGVPSGENMPPANTRKTSGSRVVSPARQVVAQRRITHG